MSIENYDPADFESVRAFVENMDRMKMIAEQKSAGKHDRIIENQNDLYDIIEEKEKDTD